MKTKKTKIVKYIKIILLCIVVGGVLWGIKSVVKQLNMEFKCDDSIVLETAQNLINKSMPNMEGNIRLRDPETIFSTQNSLTCRGYSNIRQYFTYNVEREPNGEIFVFVNPVKDIMDAAEKEYEQKWQESMKEFNNMFLY